MAKHKQVTQELTSSPQFEHDPITEAANVLTYKAHEASDHGSAIFQLFICSGGIYVSFLTWALLQERITTTPYGDDKIIFRASLVLNSVQSLFAAVIGYLYLRTSSVSRTDSPIPRIFPGADLTLRLLLVAITQTLASPLGYAALKHIDYITYILAKSCKLLPVMFLHVTVFRRRYPLYKYLVVAVVTAGVTIFTLNPAHPKKIKKPGFSDGDKNVAWGMVLLATNLLFDGLTNTIQDDIFARTRKGVVSGPQMMTALNALSSALTLGYLICSPWSNELSEASLFVTRHPQIAIDIMGFAACGAIGQVFIFHTLAKFGSLVLVTITVTRKMLSMVFSVVAFGHSLSTSQHLGVGMVFAGIGAEAWAKRQSEIRKK